MSDSEMGRPLTGWQRAHVIEAARYFRDRAGGTPIDERARAVYEGLLEVLDPARRVARRHREQRHDSTIRGSMWEQRSGRERRMRDRRRIGAALRAGEERRRAQRRGGRDRRTARG